MGTESCGNREEPRDVGLYSCGTEGNIEQRDYTAVGQRGT